MPDRTIDTYVFSAHRLNNSVNGNPRWQLHTSAGPIVISSDASVGYEVANHEPTFRANRKHGLATPARLTLTRAGRFYGLQVEPDDFSPDA